jgi:hypothetical protein
MMCACVCVWGGGEGSRKMKDENDREVIFDGKIQNVTCFARWCVMEHAPHATSFCRTDTRLAAIPLVGHSQKTTAARQYSGDERTSRAHECVM